MPERFASTRTFWPATGGVSVPVTAAAPPNGRRFGRGRERQRTRPDGEHLARGGGGLAVGSGHLQRHGVGARAGVGVGGGHAGGGDAVTEVPRVRRARARACIDGDPEGCVAVRDRCRERRGGRARAARHGMGNADDCERAGGDEGRDSESGHGPRYAAAAGTPSEPVPGAVSARATRRSAPAGCSPRARPHRGRASACACTASRAMPRARTGPGTRAARGARRRRWRRSRAA